MQRRHFLAFSFVLVGLAGYAQAADKLDPTGTWKWSVMMNNQTREMTLKLKMDGEKLTGTMLGRNNQETNIEDATFKDGEVVFSVTRERNGQKNTTKYKGKLEGDVIKGKSESTHRRTSSKSRLGRQTRKSLSIDFFDSPFMNLDAYFDRIGYSGARTATIEVLRELILKSRSIPFENLDVLLDRGISLDAQAIERKLVHNRRGGYCFEHNSLLLDVLTELGFRAAPLSARVRVNLPREVIPPRTHLFLCVQLDGVPWLVDVGVGSLSPTGPFRLDWLEIEQSTPHEPRRVVRDDQGSSHRYFHQAKLVDDWIDIHEFTMEEMPLIDREVGNCWTSMHPKSKFRLNLIVGLARADGTRVTIVNREFTHRRGAVIIERFEMSDPEHLLDVLAEWVGLRFPSGTRFGPPGHRLAQVRF